MPDNPLSLGEILTRVAALGGTARTSITSSDALPIIAGYYDRESDTLYLTDEVPDEDTVREDLVRI